MGWEPRYSEAEVRDAVASSQSLAEALRRLGLRSAGHNDRTLKRLIVHYGISTEHLDPGRSQHRPRPRHATPLEAVLVQDSSYHRGHLKQRLYDEGVKERRCEMCGQGETWRGREMSLILDHINGVANDNRLDNLRIVCPNCAATLETHCGRKNRLNRTPRRCPHCSADFVPKYESQAYCSRACGSHHTNRRRGPRPELRKVPRPTYDALRLDLTTMSLLAVGRKYGVSDNAVRKWLRAYERERGGEADDDFT
jgi:transposase-like protein